MDTSKDLNSTEKHSATPVPTHIYVLLFLLHLVTITFAYRQKSRYLEIEGRLQRAEVRLMDIRTTLLQQSCH